MAHRVIPNGPDFTVNDDYPQTLEARDPLPFPEPRIDPCVRITSRIYDPFTRDESKRYITASDCVIVPTRPDARTRRRLQSAHSSEIDWNPTPTNSGTNMSLNKPIAEDGEDAASFCSSDSSSSSSSNSFLEDSSMHEEDDTMMDIDSSSKIAQKAVISRQHQASNSSDLAYWLQRNLRDAIYGRVMFAVVLKRRSSCVPSSHHNPSNPWAEWEVTSERVAVKEMSWTKIKRERRTNNAEDPLKEVAAMQYMKRVHQRLHGPDNIDIDTDGTSSSSMEAYLETKELMLRTRVMMVLDVLSDEEFLYSIMPFCDGAELFDLLDNRERFSEGECRYWMHQILVGIESLQIAGVCHRDMSLENLMTDSSRRSMVIDMGMALRIHFQSDNGDDVFVNCRDKDRYLMRRQTICGKWNYMSPEILENRGPFDGYTVDLWAVGVILFIMLTGFPPWEQACQRRDERFKYISNGYLQPLLKQWGLPLSGDAVDLLQRMLFLNPQDRLSLCQIRAHPWMQMPVEPPP